MKTLKINVYEFEELEGDARKNAFEQVKQHYLKQNPKWYQYTAKAWEDHLKKEMGFCKADVQFDGHDASFTCEKIDFRKWMSYYKITNQNRKFFCNLHRIKGEIERDQNNPYPNCGPETISFYMEYEMSEDQWTYLIRENDYYEICDTVLREQIREIIKTMKEKIRFICRKIGEQLREEYSEMMSANSIIKLIGEDDVYNFNEEGDLVVLPSNELIELEIVEECEV